MAVFATYLLLEDLDPVYEYKFRTRPDIGPKYIDEPHLLRRPEVPGFCPSKGLVGISFTWADIIKRKDEADVGM